MIHSSRRRSALLGLGSLLIVGLAGCGDGAPPATASETKATVTGLVTVDGKAVTGGKITFDPANTSRKMAPAVTADLDSAGKYKIETLVGPNNVTIQCPGAPRGGGGPVDVKDGTNEHNVDVRTSR